MASHLLDEVEKVCTHFCILKHCNLLISVPVKEILRNEDIFVIETENMAALQQLLTTLPHFIELKQQKSFYEIYFKSNSISPSEINAYCFNNGIVLSHLEVKT
jgi:ABC-2 type transport system ATP-binding protein